MPNQFNQGDKNMKQKLYSITIGVIVAIAAALSFSVLAVAASTPSAAEWEKTVAAAKKEGNVVVSGPNGVEARDALTDGFQKRYPGIRVDYEGSSTREFATRLATERKAGQFLWDVFIHGAPETMVHMAVFDPLEPALLLPDVKNPKAWRGGAIEFYDLGKTIMVMTPYQQGTICYNTKLVNAKEFKSYKDLLDPKWKGKIVADDPRKSGPGQSTFLFFYLHPELGPDFIRALAKQQLTFYLNSSQEVDVVGQGKFPVLLGGSDMTANSAMKKGVPIAIVDPTELKEGTNVNPSNGDIALFNRAPHPNAAKVYINWLLSKEGQTAFVRAGGYVSARLDVPTDHVPAWRVPQPGAIKTYTKEAIKMKEELLPFITEIFGK